MPEVLLVRGGSLPLGKGRWVMARANWPTGKGFGAEPLASILTVRTPCVEQVTQSSWFL